MIYHLLHRLSLLFGKSEISATQFRQLAGLYSNLPLMDKISLIAQFDIPRCDAVLLIDVLYMLPDVVKSKILAGVHESLVDDGLLFVKDTNKGPCWQYAYTYLEECLKINLGVGGHKSRRTPEYKSHDEFKSLFRELGFSLIEAIKIKSIMPYPGILYVCRKI